MIPTVGFFAKIPVVRRWIGTTVRAAAFVLFVGTLVVWVRSYVVTDDIGWAAPECPLRGRLFHTYAVNVWKGRVLASRLDALAIHSQPAGYASWDSEPAAWQSGDYFPGGPANLRLGFGVASCDVMGGGSHGDHEEFNRQWLVQFPIWPLAVLFGVPAVVWVQGVWRRTRGTAAARAGLCPGCGYDLRESRERCPECGRATTPPRAIAQSTWAHELRPLAFAAVLLLTTGGAAAWAGYSRAERSRLAWEEHDRLEEAVDAATTALGQGDAEALERAFQQGAVFTPARAAEAMLKEIDEARPETARVLLEHGADVKAENGRALADAIGHGCTDLAIQLVKHGADVRAKSAGGSVPLNVSATTCRTMDELELPRLLLARGADPNALDSDGMTPLIHLVTRWERTENGRAFLELLVAHGANVNLRDSQQGLTPLGWANMIDDPDWKADLVAFLRAHGAKE